MLSSVLHSKVAVQVSINIMRTFVEMRRFIANNAALFERISSVELKQLEYQKQTDEKLDKVFEYIDGHAESEQKIFFDGQIYDAFELLISLVQKAEKKIVLIEITRAYFIQCNFLKKGLNRGFLLSWCSAESLFYCPETARKGA